jgi:hypothetical protein
MVRRRKKATGTFGVRARCVVAQVLSLAIVLASAATAGAHPGYPAVVDTALGVKGVAEMIAPPMGCQLCHVSAAGGTTQLSPFGTLLVTTYGLVESPVEQDPSLVNALAQLKAGDPKLFMDMSKGIDPNTDQTVVAETPAGPEYGCSLSPVPSLPRPSARWLALLGIAPFVRRIRRIRRTAVRVVPPPGSSRQRSQ